MNLSDVETKSSDTKRYKIAIQTDYPNMEINLKRSGWSVPFDYEVLENFARKNGEIILSRIYGDWNYNRNAKIYLSQFDVELVEVPHVLVMGHRMKDTVDTKMAMDAGMILYEYPDINMMIVASGDADFIPVIKTLKQFKAIKVIVIGERKSMSNSFGSVADQTIFYQYIADID